MRVTTILNLPRTVRNVRRVREIASVLLGHGFSEVVDQLQLQPWIGFLDKVRFWRENEAWTSRTLETRIRLSFEDLGPTFVKFGQVLATRPDVIPMSLIIELRKLQDAVSPFAYEQVEKVIEEDLGHPIGEIYEEFSRAPIAAASVAQVHKAQLKDGRGVVVKVQRPDLLRVINQDLEILQALANLMHQRLPELQKFNLPGIAQEFAAALRLESDFTNERANMERFSTLWSDDPMVNAPLPFTRYCSRRVLTMEFIQGEKVPAKDRLIELGLDPSDVAHRGTHIALRSIFEHGFFHADPHPGNFFVLPDGGITLIDFGTTFSQSHTATLVTLMQRS